MRMEANMIIITCLLLLPTIFGDVEKNETTFVPTREWQTVKKGTPLPGGLHIRHNFQTGVTEAKLMDNENVEEKNANGTLNTSSTNSLTLHPEKAILEKKDPVPIEKSYLFKHPIEELTARLKKITQDDGKNIPELDDEHTLRVKQKFKDYETLKKEFKALEVNITTDSELLNNYFQKFQIHKNGITLGTLTTAETEEVLDILYNLEYLLHHIDNAKVFANMQGMNKIISPCLNGTNNEIKTEALRVLGVAVQSNPNVQLKALENDLVQKLLHILTTHSKVEVKSRCLFALSALIRQFPAAQKVWIDHGGIEIFGKMLINDQLQVQMKVMNLINDLIIERQNLEKITDAIQHQLKVNAYATANIEKKLLTYEYCNHLCNLMITSFKDGLSDQSAIDNYEFLETISNSMITAASICSDRFKESKDELLPIIQHLLNFYEDLNLLVDKLQTENPHDEL
ncbi:Nucleotide exchange factor SIL1 [Eufriesea mexicana]|uniref:Nucleotide exchange factor SIL1 n=1 Tax=Eufriesea mexicana TaxID=516756 RepID=A0A310SV48_9HYME|nr:PREDICTED: nucleotide exchange factor SIL1 [Eufriesea mexicana]OAD62230.1 Nucleotide exchange factor SIL1 [Eufriesea mexicana]